MSIDTYFVVAPLLYLCKIATTCFSLNATCFRRSFDTLKDAAAMTDDDTKAGPPASDRGVYGISVVAELSGINEQSLRLYERHGLLIPERSAGGPAATAPTTWPGYSGSASYSPPGSTSPASPAFSRWKTATPP